MLEVELTSSRIYEMGIVHFYCSTLPTSAHTFGVVVVLSYQIRNWNFMYIAERIRIQ